MINEIVKKIDGEIKELRNLELIDEYDKGTAYGFRLAKEIILSEQKEPSWKQYIRERQITIIDDHCVCGMAIDNGWEFCPKCGRQIKGRGYSIPPNKPLTKGDVIRESNESLAEFMHSTAYSCEQCVFICYDEDSKKSCAYGRKTTCKDGILQYLNQPQEDTNE